MSDSLQAHELQHARPPCPSPNPRVYSNSSPLSRWCHPAISSSVSPSPPAFNLSQHQTLPMSQFFAPGGRSIGISASTSVLPVNTQYWYPLGRTGWISLLFKRPSRVFSNTIVQKHLFIVQLSHPSMTTGKTIALTRWTFVGKVMSLLFNMLSRLVITFLPRSKHLLISWLQSTSTVFFESKKITCMLTFTECFVCVRFVVNALPFACSHLILKATLWVRQTQSSPVTCPKSHSR